MCLHITCFVFHIACFFVSHSMFSVTHNMSKRKTVPVHQLLGFSHGLILFLFAGPPVIHTIYANLWQTFPTTVDQKRTPFRKQKPRSSPQAPLLKTQLGVGLFGQQHLKPRVAAVALECFNTGFLLVLSLFVFTV